jgi:serine/threonine protein kinase
MEEVFGHYRVSAVLHHGKTGVVYLGSFGGSGKRVAIKALDAQVGNDLVLRERFIRGARALSLVKSPHLATIYEVGVQMPSGHVWCAMELIEGRSLAAALVAEGPLAPAAARHVAKQLATALAAVHAGGVIHRNVKPANVMLTRSHGDPSFVRLVGFGLVKLADTAGAGEELTARGAILGTPAYMAPEALVDSSQVDHTADVYSLGVVMYETLTGELPFQGTRSAIEQLRAKQAGPPPLRVDPALDELVGRMMAPIPGERPQSMEEVHATLQANGFDEEMPTRRDFTPAPIRLEPILDIESGDPTLPGKPPPHRKRS